MKKQNQVVVNSEVFQTEISEIILRPKGPPQSEDPTGSTDEPFTRIRYIRNEDVGSVIERGNFTIEISQAGRGYVCFNQKQISVISALLAQAAHGPIKVEINL